MAPSVRRKRRLTGEELAAWRAFLRAHAAVTRALERDLQDAAAPPLSGYGVLLRLAEAPDARLRPGELAERALLTKSGLTRLLDRLEEQGYVERRACAEDARGQYAELTARGRRALRRAAPTHLRGIARYFVDPLSARDRAILTDALERVAAAAESR